MAAILVVDDEYSARTTLALLLRHRGHVVREADGVTAAIHELRAGVFDVIVGNPPYVKVGDRPALQPEVRDHEPSVALFGGASGVDVMTDLVSQAPQRLRPGGCLVFEFGFGQEIAAEDLIDKTPGLSLVGLRRDLQGLARTAVATRS